MSDPLDARIVDSLAALPMPDAPESPLGERALGLASHALDAINPVPGIAEIGQVVASAAHAVTQPGAWDAFSGNVKAGFQRAMEADNINGDSYTMYEAYAPIVEAINKDRPASERVPNPYMHSEWNLFGAAAQYLSGQPNSREGIEDLVFQRLDRLRTSNPGAAGNLPKNRADLLQEVQAEQRTAIEYSDSLARSTGAIGTAGQFVGSAVGGLTDPVNILATMAGAPASTSLLRTFLIEGGVNTAASLAGLPFRKARYDRLGEPLSGEQMAAELAGSFVLGGAIPTGAKALARALMHGEPHAVVEAMDRLHPNAADLSPDIRTARNIAADDVQRSNTNPFSGDAPGEDLHRQSLLQTMHAADEGRPDLIPDRTAEIARATDPAWTAAQHRAGTSIEAFTTDQLETDAAQMQYKGGGDEHGVIDTLKGVTEWDPVAAGISLVWRTREGRNIVANGHQRRGLAAALESGGHPPITHYARVLNEADGLTAQDARVIGALVNIKEGSGSAIDAARVLREAPEKATGLPPRSALVRRARDLRALGDDAWGMAINGHVSERDAAIVGRHVSDPQMQTAILGHLAKDSPETAEEAELYVRQALAAGATKQVQTDMFGNFLKSDLVLPERVKILKSALSTLRRDKSLFSTLTKNENALEEAGNFLNTSANAQREQTAATAFAVLKALAERKGPISDALQTAAETALKTGNRRAAAQQFVAHVRAAVGRGELDGGATRAGLGDVESAPEAPGLFAQDEGRSARDIDPAELKGFDDPDAKPEAFVQQSKALARELAGTDHTPPAKAAGADAPEFGAAQDEIEALRKLPDDLEFGGGDLFGRGADETITIKDARADLERQARAVERLRGCVERGD